MRRGIRVGATVFLAAALGAGGAASAGGRRHYRAPAATTQEIPPPLDPSCDYGYPYSGSSRYFAEPLTELRHSEPFGALLGYHVRRPC